MKKVNWIILALVVIVSVFLLWLWYYLGFNRVDSPLDLALSLIWWVILIAGILIIWRLEKSRKERIRTLYIGEKQLFNSEKGIRDFTDPEHLMHMMGLTLEELKYNFNREDLPDASELPIQYYVHTSKYAADTSDKDKNDWKGEVCLTGEDEVTPFETREELYQIITETQAQLALQGRTA